MGDNKDNKDKQDEGYKINKFIDGTKEQFKDVKVVKKEEFNKEEFKEKVKSLGIEVNIITEENRREQEDKDLALLKVYEDKYGKSTKEAYEEYKNLDEEGYARTFDYDSYEYALYNWVGIYAYYKLKGFDESRVN